MLRIETETHGHHERTIRATGKLAGPWVAELRRSVALRDGGQSLVLDLTDVSFVDRDGIEFLRCLRNDTGVMLRCSAFVAAQLM
jgi:anti-anti-sigma regulatory factor